MPKFQVAAKEALGNSVQRRNLAHATGIIRTKRADVVGELDNWEQLRLAAEAIKDRALLRLDEHLEAFEANATAAGATVHWARDAEEANRIVVDLVQAKGATEVVKVKSMATQEIELNEALAAAGIDAWETDLAELIVQLGDDWPSHILVPAIHRNRAEVREIFLREMGKVGRPAPADLTDEPRRLAEAARLHLREKFLRAKVAISGANFAIADTGSLVVVESEGNGRMCLTLPETLISVVGIEKVLPSWRDLEVFLQVLPRSSTGERENPYTSIWTGPAAGDGPVEMHIVLIDNGRTNVLADTLGRPGVALHPVLGLPERLPGVRAGGRAFLRFGVPGADRRRTDAPIARHRKRCGQVAAVRIESVRRLFRRLPGAHRHPVAAGAPAYPGRRREPRRAAVGRGAGA